MPLTKIQIEKKAVDRVKEGHPWVWANEMKGQCALGNPILLCDSKGKAVAFALQDSGAIGARVLSKTPDRLDQLVQKRVAVAYDLRQRILPFQTNAYRLINGAGDGLEGLVIDIYAHLAVIRVYSKSWEKHLDIVVQSLKNLPFLKTIYRRFGVRNVDGKNGGITLYGSEPEELLVIEEHGVRFLTRPKIGQKTGLFLDQREHRIFLAQRCRGLRLLNLFCYTGGFGVHAAVRGARFVASVDISAQALEDAKENFRLNGLDPAEHAFHCVDVFSLKERGIYDLVICDPPSLSHQKKSDRAAFQTYERLAGHSASLLHKGGLLALASCSARLNAKQWEKASQSGIKKYGHWSWLWRAYDPPDHPVSTAHPEGRYLKFALLHKQR